MSLHGPHQRILRKTSFYSCNLHPKTILGSSDVDIPLFEIYSILIICR